MSDDKVTYDPTEMETTNPGEIEGFDDLVDESQEVNDAPSVDTEQVEDSTPEPSTEPTFEHDPVAVQAAMAAGLGMKEIEAIKDSNTLYEYAQYKLGQTQQPEQPQEPAFEKFEVDLPEDEFDPKLKETLESMNEHYSKYMEKVVSENQELKQQLGGFNQAQVRAAETELERRFDDAVAGIGDQRFGTGASNSMPVHSPEFQERQKLANTIQGLAQSFPNEGIEDLTIRAYRAMYGADLENQALGKVRGEVQKANNRMTARPSARKENAPAPRMRDGVDLDKLAEFNAWHLQNSPSE